MKRITVALVGLLLFCAQPFVQFHLRAAVTVGNSVAWHVADNADTTATSPPIDTLGASALLFGNCWTTGAGGAISTPTDDESNTWVGLGTTTQGFGTSAQWYYDETPATNATHLFTINATGQAFGAGIVVVLHGTAAASIFDQEGGAGASGQSTFTSASVTPTTDNQIVLNLLSHRSIEDLVASSVDSPFTLGASLVASRPGGNPASQGCAFAYHVQTTAGADDVVFTMNGTEDEGAIRSATFKMLAAAAGGPRGFGFGVWQ